jgi:RNA polymerase primary sigma factor
VSDLADVLAAVQATPNRTAVELRNALRSSGRVSITVADVRKVLESHPHRFRSVTSGSVQRWSASACTTTMTPPARPRRTLRWPGPELYRWQLEALDAWRARRCCGVIDAVTGTGKTMVGVVAAWEELARGGQACVLVPTRDLLYQWRGVLSGVTPPGTRIGLVGDGHRGHLGTCDVVVAVVNSARTADLRPRRPGGLLVADECHRYGSDENRLVLRDEFVRRLGLSATYARSDDAHLAHLDPYFGGPCFRLGYAQAISQGVVAPFRLALVGVRFSAADRAAYESLGVDMATCRARLLRSGQVRREPIGAFLADVTRIARVPSELAVAAMGYLSAMAERRRLLAETPAKLAALERLGDAMAEASRTIVFTQTIRGVEQAAMLLRERGLRATVVHSGLETAVCRDRLAEFVAGTVTVLCAPEMLDEGVDVPAAELAVILAASQSRRQMVQRLGRVLRRKPDGRHARFVNVYVVGTSEDPASGAHKGFLDEVTPLASSLETWSGDEHPPNSWSSPAST